jgi:hypothetical protein
MPFANPSAHVFTSMAIQKNAPTLPGVYGISNAAEWLYVGESDNLRESLMCRLQESGTWLSTRMPTGFTFELCRPDERVRRQDQLVRELEPICNRRPDPRSVGERAAPSEAKRNSVRSD